MPSFPVSAQIHLSVSVCHVAVPQPSAFVGKSEYPLGCARCVWTQPAQHKAIFLAQGSARENRQDLTGSHAEVSSVKRGTLNHPAVPQSP